MSIQRIANTDDAFSVAAILAVCLICYLVAVSF